MQATIASIETDSVATHGTTTRVASVDVLRGLVMIIMAIDHVRVYSGLPAGGLDPGIFFTRWITHFCAPAFAFFAGTSAFLYYARNNDRKKTVTFLVSRGIILVLLELTLIRLCWTFNLDFQNYTLAGVIWMLGWCMILLAPMIQIRPVILGAIGLAIVFGQQVFSSVSALFPGSMEQSVSNLWNFFYPTVARNNSLSGTSGLMNVYGISILYVLIPWIGVMMCGFAFGALLQKDRLTVKRYSLMIGLTSIVLFVVVATILALGSDDQSTPLWYRILGQRKYPASQLYLLMTLGPIIALVPWAENVKGKIAETVRVVGRVPMFFYLMHIPLIHISALIVNYLLSGASHHDWYATAPLVTVSPEEQWSLPLLYLIWSADTLLLIRLSIWYARYKAENPKWWMKYL